MDYPIIKKHIQFNHNHNVYINPIGMVLHSTDTNGATDERFFDVFNGSDKQASAHAFIDWDSITELVNVEPDAVERAWHAGRYANDHFIGVEMCEPKFHNQKQFVEVWNRTVWYFAYCFVHILKITTVTKDNLLSHAEVSMKWHETDHTDPVAFLKSYNASVDAFRAAVQTEINKIIAGNATYKKISLTHVLECDPLSLRAEVVKTAGSKIQGDFVNGTFFGNHDGQFVSVGAIVNEGKLVCKRLDHDNVKRAHFIVYNDGSVAVKMIMDIDKEEDLSKIHFAIEGFNMFPINLKAEWWPDDVGRGDWRTVLGYNPTTKKAIIAVRPWSDAKRGQATLKNLDCDRGIGLDSGTSTNARFAGKTIRLTDRVLHNIIRWKG